MKKNEKIQAACLIIYLIACITTLALILVFKNAYILLAFGIVLVVGYFLVSLVHSLNYFYVCPKCKHEFKTNVFNDIFTTNGGKLGKKVTCPACGERTYMKDEPLK